MKIDEEQSFDIDLGEWNVCQQAGIALAQELDRVMLPLMSEILQDMFRNYPPLLDLHLPWETADRSELAIRLDLPLQNPGDYGVSYTCSLRVPLVDDLIETRFTPNEDDDAKVGVRIAVYLRELADKLDKACG